MDNLLQFNDIQISQVLLNIKDPKILETIARVNKRLYKIYNKYIRNHVIRLWDKIAPPFPEIELERLNFLSDFFIDKREWNFTRYCEKKGYPNHDELKQKISQLISNNCENDFLLNIIPNLMKQYITFYPDDYSNILSDDYDDYDNFSLNGNRIEIHHENICDSFFKSNLMCIFPTQYSTILWFSLQWDYEQKYKIRFYKSEKKRNRYILYSIIESADAFFDNFLSL